MTGTEKTIFAGSRESRVLRAGVELAIIAAAMAMLAGDHVRIGAAEKHAPDDVLGRERLRPPTARGGWSRRTITDARAQPTGLARGGATASERAQQNARQSRAASKKKAP